jgi:hypothetical protein
MLHLLKLVILANAGHYTAPAADCTNAGRNPAWAVLDVFHKAEYNGFPEYCIIHA